MRVKNQKSQLKTKKTVEKTLQSICVYKGKRNGFTLIEVIISLAIFSLLSIAIVNFINVSLKTNQKSEVKQQATLLGQSLLEELGSFNQLKIGSNELFGLSNVVVEDENCLNSQYCMNDLDIKDFNVGISINLLKNNSNQQVQSFSNVSQESSLYIEVTNQNIIGQVRNNPLSIFTKANQDQLIITISEDHSVSLKSLLTNNHVKLTGLMDTGNTTINIKTDNQNDAITGITINNKSDLILEGCLQNNDEGGHLNLSDITVVPEYKGNFKIIENGDICSFKTSDGVNNSFQSTTTSDLYEVQINIYYNNSNELVFSGDRVLPLDFIREEEAK